MKCEDEVSHNVEKQLSQLASKLVNPPSIQSTTAIQHIYT